MATEYQFHTVWHLDAPREQVWDALYDARRWPVWWKGLEAVVQLVPGNECGEGSVQRYTWRGHLPYRLTFDMQVTRVISPLLMEGVASGEVEGNGRWVLSAHGPTTAVAYFWRIRTTRRWMNLLEPVARPLFCWNHNQVMRCGGIGLARFLDAPLLSMTFA